MVSARVVGQKFGPRVPKDPEVPIIYLITRIKISHFHQSQLLTFDHAVDNASPCGVFAKDVGERSRVAEISKGK